MSIVVFYLDEFKTPHAEHFSDLGPALQRTSELRSAVYNTHVTISSELPQCIGKPGVDEVLNGKTPDGSDYTWSKAHRGRR